MFINEIKIVIKIVVMIMGRENGSEKKKDLFEVVGIEDFLQRNINNKLKDEFYLEVEVGEIEIGYLNRQLFEFF